MARVLKLLACAAIVLQARSAFSLSFGPSSFTAPGAFPTSLYKSYHNNPTATSAQPQPVISDPVLHKVYPFGLTDPKNIPQNDPQDPHPLPPRASDPLLLQNAIAQVQGLFANTAFASNTCALCTATLEVAKFLSLAAPDQGPAFTVFLCQQFKLSSSCNTTFGATTLGPVLTQVFANADVSGYDGRMICQNFLASSCTLPPTPALNLTGWFAKPKPSPLPPPKTPSGQRLKVLHLSDFHLDPRYATSSEANCTSSLCCRANNHNANSPNQTLLPAPRYGWFKCDTPFSLAAAALEAIPVLADTEKTGFAWTIYTGDLVSHDLENQLSRDYVMYTETVVYDLFKRILGSGPVYAALGNHDSYNQAQDAPHSLGGTLAKQFSWNYDHVAGLWQQEQWIPSSAVAQARAHYAAYSVQRSDGLRVITLNTDLWYRANWFNYINLSGADNSGMLRFLTDELQDAEDKGDRVWIMGHVLSGWDGTNGLEVPTNLFYQIVDRFSPHVIANIFWGHTHEDQLSIFYANNATDISAETALATSWMGPSITPLTNLNSGFRVYEVDSAVSPFYLMVPPNVDYPNLVSVHIVIQTFDILDAHTWRSDVNSFPSLDGQTMLGPTYVYEYSTRAAYGANISGWGSNDPLNATWWHLVTEQMEANPDLVTVCNFSRPEALR
ncbi:Metallo-dependent phosphatase-like protein [Multifurca ochricompacta]|uniref:Metallo-dependent phosphatase-like protein n=1 Tax=Multifurca ochricompacta TaxID=376703 RepID=A0AAD4MDH1_9AGAM|nr:Metallo-dependent phosphatase-like protein [Multifurca ochricompacta]